MALSTTVVLYTAPFNISGQPAISLPMHWTEDGLPVGVQLVAAYGREDQLLQVAAQLEQAAPWADRTIAADHRYAVMPPATGITAPVR